MKLKLLLILLLPVRLFAQYQIELSTETYTELTGATELSYDASQGGYYHAMDFTFPTFRRTADLSEVPSAPSNGAYVTAQGYVAVYEKPGYKNTIVYHCLFANNKFDQVPGMTKVSAKLEGTTPNRIAKFQWKDLVYDGNNTQTANFQAWLHEATGNISYHYGPHTLPTPNSLQVFTGIIVLNVDFSALLDQYSLTGTPTSKEKTTGFTTMTFPPMTGIPVNGSVITLKRFYTSVDDITGDADVQLFPNPASTVVSLRLQHSANVKMFDAMGKLVLNDDYAAGNNKMPLQQFSNGMYIMQITSVHGVAQKKLFINK